MENSTKLVKICKRYEAMCKKYKLECDDRLSTMMDLASVEAEFNKEGQDGFWDSLLEAPDYDFSHDLGGIKRHIDRRNYPATLTGCFVPRFVSHFKSQVA